MQSSTKKSTRIMIWIIAIVMAIGSMTAYFAIILQNNNAQSPAAQQQTEGEGEKQELTVDPSAFKVEGKVAELVKTDLKKGEGKAVKEGDTITVHYKGTIAQTGEKFDSSYDHGEPVTFELSGVIEGWQEGIPGMKAGGKRRLIIPSNVAYGEQGAPPTIAPNTDLVFEVELLSIGGKAE